MSTSTEQRSATKTGFAAEWASLKTPEAKTIATEPTVGAKAPSTSQLPLPDGKKTVILFLRHCGCPFAEKTFRSLAALSEKHRNVHFIAVSHSSPETTERWIPQVGGAWQVEVLIDEGRDMYAQWGLGVSSTWHAFNPMALYSVYRLGVDEGIWNKPTESGTRWQTSGAFAVDPQGIVRWLHVSKAADHLPDFDAALQSIGAASLQEAPNK